jgi:hypothetical protein
MDGATGTDERRLDAALPDLAAPDFRHIEIVGGRTMSRQMQDFYTVEQLAKRWSIDGSQIHQLILSHRLPQAYLLAGTATLTLRPSIAAKAAHKLGQHTHLDIRLLTRARAGIKDRFMWSLADIECIYECLAGGANIADELTQLCEEERRHPSGWVLTFDSTATQVGGEDSFELALRSLRDTSLISTAAIVRFEEQQQAPLHDEPLPAARPAPVQDSRRQRCRAVAQILWERDERATVPDLYRSEWIQRIACEGKVPTEKTFREWIKDLNPDRSPGRRTI